MAKQEPLFELIRSMSQSEKRYFKRFSALQKESVQNAYVVLFNAIEKQSHYDEKPLLDLIGKVYFAQQKRHLYVKLMECLRSYHAEKTVDSKIAALLSDYSILMEKSLIRQASKALQKAGKMAHEHERYAELIKIKKIESQFLWTENNIAALEAQTIAFRKTTKDVVKVLENQLAFEKEYLHLIKWNRRIEFVRNETELKELQQIMHHPVFEKESNALSMEARVHFYYCKGLFFFFQAEFRDSNTHFVHLLQLLEANSVMQKEEKLLYVRTLCNCCLLSLKLKNMNGFEELYGKLKSINDQPIQIQRYVDYMVLLFELMQLNLSKAFKKAQALVDKHSETIAALEIWMDEKEVMGIEKHYWMFQAITAYMYSGEYKKALKIMNNYLNNAPGDFKEDSYCIAIILNVFIHFEMGKRDLIEYSLKSIERFLKQKGRVNEFERIIMSFVKKCLEQNNEKELQKLLEALVRDLKGLKHKKFERIVFEYFDFIAWVEWSVGKVQRKT